MPEFICPSCTSKLRLKDSQLGRRVRCRCGYVFRAVNNEQPAEPPQPYIEPQQPVKVSPVNADLGGSPRESHHSERSGSRTATEKGVTAYSADKPGPDPKLVDPWAQAANPYGQPIVQHYSVRVPYYVAPHKSRVAAGLLGIFLGCWGIHNFYLGHVGLGIAQCCLTILGIITACFVVGIFLLLAVSMWTWIEAIMCFAGARLDSDGRVLV